MSNTDPQFTLAKAIQVDNGPVMCCEVTRGGCGKVCRRNECRLTEFVTGAAFTCPQCGRIMERWKTDE